MQARAYFFSNFMHFLWFPGLFLLFRSYAQQKFTSFLEVRIHLLWIKGIRLFFRFFLHTILYKQKKKQRIMVSRFFMGDFYCVVPQLGVALS